MVLQKLYSRNSKSANREISSIPSGVSLVELIIVLGISSLLVAGSFAWFGSNRVTEFYDHARQFESAVREVQTQIASNYMPGFTDACTTETRTKVGFPNCPIGKDQQILATSVGINTAAPNNKQINIGYYKSYIGTTTKKVRDLPLPNVENYSNSTVILNASIQVKDFKVYNNAPCTTTNLPYNNSDGISPQAGSSTITFRRDPNILNHFSGTPSTSYYGAAGWGGDNPFQDYINAVPPVSVGSIPCAVMWNIESVELNTAGTRGRFNAQIIFDIRNRTITLQTNQP